MTKPNQTLLGAFLSLAIIGGGAPRTEAADPPAPIPPPVPSGPVAPSAPIPPLPPGVVARVRGKDVTRTEFEKHLVERLRPEMAAEPKCPATTILEILIQNAVIGQEAERLGIVVSKADVDAVYQEQDAKLRLASNGKTNIAGLMKETGENPVEWMAKLRELILEERVAAHPTHLGDKLPKEDNARLIQVSVVVRQLISRAKIERVDLPPGVAVRVNGVPVTNEEFGKALADKLAPDRLYELLKELAAAMLLEDEGAHLSDAEMEKAVAIDKAHWNALRAMAPQPELQTVSYEDWTRARNGRPLEVLKHDRYFRGRLALLARFRSKLTDDDIRKEYVRGATTLYGASAVVTDIQATFKVKTAVMETAKRRSRDEAQRIVRDYARRLEAGEAGDKVIKEIEALADPSLTAKLKRVSLEGNGQSLFMAIDGLKDGAWSAPVETLSEVHLVRRERFTPAPTYEAIADDVREDLLFVKYRSWLEDQMRDDRVVRIEMR